MERYSSSIQSIKRLGNFSSYCTQAAIRGNDATEKGNASTLFLRMRARTPVNGFTQTMIFGTSVRHTPFRVGLTGLSRQGYGQIVFVRAVDCRCYLSGRYWIREARVISSVAVARSCTWCYIQHV
jgi:hypothetical protein